MQGRARRIASSAKRSLKGVVQEVDSMTHSDTISFNRGHPCTQAFAISKIEECIKAILENDGATVLQYGRSPGYPPLRQLLAEWNGVDSERVLISHGSRQILRFISDLLVKPGDTVFVEEPTYDVMLTLLREKSAQVVGIPMQVDGLDVELLADRLEQTVPRLLYTIPDFHNPTGTTLSLVKRKAVIEMAQGYGFLIVEDVPYRLLRYKGNDLPTLWSLDDSCVLQVTSFSKVLSPGIRTGYVVAPEAVIQKLAKIAFKNYGTPCLLSQGLVWEFCRRGWLGPEIERLRDLYRPRLKAMLAALSQYLPQASWWEPEGGYYVGITLPESCDMKAFRQRAKRAAVILSQGEGFFGHGGERFLRLPFAGLQPEEIGEGISRLARATQGVQLLKGMKQWVD